MRQVFSVQPANGMRSLAMEDVVSWMDATTNLNRSLLKSTWSGVQLHFHVARGQMRLPEPDITSLLPGTLAFRAALKDRLFPSHDGLEFLSATVGEEDWLLLNCLNSIDEFDEQRSRVHRGVDGSICFAETLVIPASVSLPEIFTLADSNRARLFVTSAFKSRIEQSGCQGITFEATDFAPNYRQRAGP